MHTPQQQCEVSVRRISKKGDDMNNSPVRLWAALLSLISFLSYQSALAQCLDPVELADITANLDIGFGLDHGQPQPDIVSVTQGVPIRGFVHPEGGDIGSVQCETDYVLTYLWIGTNSRLADATPEERIQRVTDFRARFTQLDFFIDGLPIDPADVIETEPRDGFNPHTGDPMAYLFVGWISEPMSLSPGTHEARLDAVIEFPPDIFPFQMIVSFDVLSADIDSDGVFDHLDNCLIVANSDQADRDSNGVGNLCDIGTKQTFSDGGSPIIGDGGGCVDCTVNGWFAFGGGGVALDAGDEGIGDHAVLFDAGGEGFHFLTWIGWAIADTGFLGDLHSAYVVGVQFKARHSGIGESVMLRAFLFNFADGRNDAALSNDAVSIANTDLDWNTYSFSLAESNLEARVLGATTPRTLNEILSNVEQLGFRHDPGFTGPGTPAFVSSAVFFDDIQLIVDFDIDGDGIANDLDTAPRSVSSDFSDGTTSGTITDPGNRTLTINDEPNPDGVRLTAPDNGGSGVVARVQVCDASAVLVIRERSDLVVTCGSVFVEVEPDSTPVDMEVTLNGETAIITVPAENQVAYEPETATLTVTIDPTLPPPEPVVLNIGGAEIPIPPGETTRLIAIDVKPGSDPNCFNINGQGVIPVAILGSAILDVTDIDQYSLSFSGLEVRVKGNKGPLCGLEDANGDEFLDLVCLFEDDASSWNASSGTATLTAELLDGTLISGTDSICVVP